MKLQEIRKEIEQTKTFSLWQKVGIHAHHGIALPLASLHSKKSAGLGEFLDLLPIIDWCHRLGMDIIQLLPLNDTALEPSPYFAISSCALNPIYITLSDLPESWNQPLQEDLQSLQALTLPEQIPYKILYTKKIHYLKKIFSQQKKSIVEDPLFSMFIREHAWLPLYGLFVLFGQKEKTFDWQKWPPSLHNPSIEKMQPFLETYREELLFLYFVQYIAFSQLGKVKEYATQKKIQILGDLPILISPHSADVYWYSSLFDLQFSAGAPPDNFNPQGQTWNFPLFNWNEMKKNHFSWWQERLKVAGLLYHIYRLDHVVGFFRIWAVPHGKKAVSGFFLPQDRSLWKKRGEEHLSSLISLSSILPVAEDLGLIPPETFATLKELGICGTRVMRWMNNKKISDYDPLSITTLSTHDTETLQEWWQNHPQEAALLSKEKHWSYSPSLTLEQRRALLWDAHHTSSLFHINFLQEYLALFPPFTWGSPEKERINIPGKILSSNWCYRFRPSIEEFSHHEPLAKEIRSLLSSSP